MQATQICRLSDWSLWEVRSKKRLQSYLRLPHERTCWLLLANLQTKTTHERRFFRAQVRSNDLQQSFAIDPSSPSANFTAYNVGCFLQHKSDKQCNHWKRIPAFLQLERVLVALDNLLTELVRLWWSRHRSEVPGSIRHLRRSWPAGPSSQASTRVNRTWTSLGHPQTRHLTGRASLFFDPNSVRSWRLANFKTWKCPWYTRRWSSRFFLWVLNQGHSIKACKD